MNLDRVKGINLNQFVDGERLVSDKHDLGVEVRSELAELESCTSPSSYAGSLGGLGFSQLSLSDVFLVTPHQENAKNAIANEH